MITTDKMLTDDEAAEMLGLRPQTLAVWRCTGRNSLPYVQLGRAIRYRASDVQAFIEANTKGKPTPKREKQTA